MPAIKVHSPSLFYFQSALAETCDMTNVSARERELEPGNFRSHRAVVCEVPITWPQAGSRAQRVGQFGAGKLIKRGSKMFG
jgi:hypothetical protein